MKSSPLWEHPKVKITPHIASLTYPKQGVLQVLESFNLVKKGLAPRYQVDRDKMY